jgi:hypothetical protein
MKWVPLLVAMLASAPGAARAADGPAPPMLAKIFRPDMLGARVAYFEHVVGPAWRIEGRLRRYKVGDCTVTIAVRAGEIKSLSLDLDQTCTIDPAPFLEARLPSANRMTFGDFDRAYHGRFYADCLTLCSNRADPVVFEHFDGPHALNFVEVNLQAALVDDAVIKAADEWSGAIASTKGSKFVEHRGFNCTGQFDAAAHKAFQMVRLTAITIGEGLALPRCGGRF